MIKLNYIKWLGLQSYLSLEEHQKSLVPKILQTSNIIFFGQEFEPVLTLGIRADDRQEFLWTEKEFEEKNLEVVRTDRGGQATIHSPGQLVIYPMLDLRIYRYGVKDFVELLMLTTAQTLAAYGVPTRFLMGQPGLYTDFGKIAFCGLKIDRGVVRHGISININNDLNLFRGVRSCGNALATLDQLSRYQKVELPEFFKLWAGQFQKHFHLSASLSLDMNI